MVYNNKKAIKPKSNGVKMNETYEVVNMNFKRASDFQMNLLRDIEEYAEENGLSRVAAIRMLVKQALMAAKESK